MAADKTMLSGSTMMLLLKLLSEKDMYGYEMIETLCQLFECTPNDLFSFDAPPYEGFPLETENSIHNINKL